jgi:hypothetical protein
MIYVFDTSSLSNLKHFYPAVFTTVWSELDRIIGQGDLISTKEVWNEMQRGNPAQHTKERFINNLHMESNARSHEDPSIG